jgi:hypothetical protein
MNGIWTAASPSGTSDVIVEWNMEVRLPALSDVEGRRRQHQP